MIATIRQGSQALPLTELGSRSNTWFYLLRFCPSTDRFQAKVRQVPGDDPRFEVSIESEGQSVRVVLRPTDPNESDTFRNCEWFFRIKPSSLVLCLADKDVIERMPYSRIYETN